MSVLVFSERRELRFDCESKFLKNGFLDFNIISSLNNIQSWLSFKKIDYVFIDYFSLGKLKLSQVLKHIKANVIVYLLDQENIFEVNPAYVKVSLEDWEEALEKAMIRQPKMKSKPNSILIKINTRYIRLKIEDIEYVSSEGKFVNIAIKDKTYTTRSQLQLIAELLPQNFMLVHRSYILNTNKIKSIHVAQMEVELENYKIPFSRKHKQSLLGYFQLSI